MVQHGRILFNTAGVILWAMERGNVSQHQTQTVQAHKCPSGENSNRSEPAVSFPSKAQRSGLVFSLQRNKLSTELKYRTPVVQTHTETVKKSFPWRLLPQ